MARKIPMLLFFVLCAMFGYGLTRGNPNQPPHPMVGQLLPEFSVPSLFEGQPPLDSKNFKREPYVLHIFASWCSICALEHEVIVHMAEKHGIPLIGIAWHDTAEKAREWLEKHGSPYSQVGLDEKGALTVPLAFTGVPESFLIDRDGRIVQKNSGPITGQMLHNSLLPKFQELQHAP